jgi:hypothetical protein
LSVSQKHSLDVGSSGLGVWERFLRRESWNHQTRQGNLVRSIAAVECNFVGLGKGLRPNGGMMGAPEKFDRGANGKTEHIDNDWKEFLEQH